MYGSARWAERGAGLVFGMGLYVQTGGREVVLYGPYSAGRFVREAWLLGAAGFTEGEAVDEGGAVGTGFGDFGHLFGFGDVGG